MKLFVIFSNYLNISIKSLLTWTSITDSVCLVNCFFTFYARKFLILVRHTLYANEFTLIICTCIEDGILCIAQVAQILITRPFLP